MKDDPLKILNRLIEIEDYQSKTGLIAKPFSSDYVVTPIDEIEFIEYPPESRENPFDANSSGKYFVYMTNRSPSISYLGETIEDFKENNARLHKSISMGYSSLWVMQRIYLIDKNHNEFRWEWNEEDKNKTYDARVFSLFDPMGALRYPDIIARVWEQKETAIRFELYDDAVEFAKKAIAETSYPIVCAMRVASYHWH